MRYPPLFVLHASKMSISVGVSHTFIFSAWGSGGESEVPGGGRGDDFLLKIPGGGSPGRVGAAGRGAGRVFAGNLKGGGLNIFFQG